jgi:hypothetical protein
MGIGPFTTYAPPGVYTQTVLEPAAGALLDGVRIPVYIGTGRETLSQTDFEMVRGSSSQADTPIFGEDVSGRWVVSGANNNPTLGPTDGSRTRFRVRNYPIVDGSGSGKVTYDSSKVSVSVNGQPAAVSAVDGPNGVITLLVPPSADDFVVVNYYFHRKDTRITDTVSSQVSDGPAVLIAPKSEPYAISSSSNTLIVFVNDSPLPSTITLATGTNRTAASVANDINAAGIPDLTANVVTDNQGLNHLFITASGNVSISSGNANGALGFNFGDYTNRNKNFVVFNGPIVDGTDGGVTTTDPSKVVVKVNNVQVLARLVDGANRTVTLNLAPPAGSSVTIEYWFNSWQDTFDYLPNSNIAEVGNVGISPGRRDFVNGFDFIVVNDGDQSKIQWGTSYTVASGVRTGSISFDNTQIVGLLVDDRLYGVECERFVDAAIAQVSLTKFVLPVTPTTGNGRDTPLNISVFNSITNGRMDLPTDNPNLVTAYVGKTWRDAYARGPVTVLEVDGASNVITLRESVPADYKVFATFWYNRIADDTLTFSVVTPGPTGVGQYTISSRVSGNLLYGVKFGTKSALPETIQWPSGVETNPDAFMFGGQPVAETVTVTFDSALQPARNASITNSFAEPYDIYAASSSFGNMRVDGNAAFAVNLQTAFAAQLLGVPVDDPSSFAASDRIQLQIDGISLLVDVSAATSMSDVAIAINATVDADITTHDDGTPTFLATAPNNLASVVTHGSQVILKVSGRNVNGTAADHFISSVKVQVATGTGITDASAVVGLTFNQESLGSYDAINQPAFVAATKDAPFAITAGLNNRLLLNVDGVDFQAELPGGSAVTLDQVVTAINDAYLPFASSSVQATLLADLLVLANAIESNYSSHIGSSVFHDIADAVNLVTAGAAVDLATLISLVNDVKMVYNDHISNTGGSFHNLADSSNSVTVADATDLASASALAHELKVKFNLHLIEKGVHGHDDVSNNETNGDATVRTVIGTANVGGEVEITTSVNHGFMNGDLVFVTGVGGTTEANSSMAGEWSIMVTALNAFTLTGSAWANAWTSGGTVLNFTQAVTLLNSLRTNYTNHLVEAGVHLVNDTVNTLTAAAITTDDVFGPYTQASALANDLKAKFNAHIASTTYHVVADTTNAVSTANSTAASLSSVITLANAIKAAFNGHLAQTQGIYHVHGTNDTTNDVSVSTTEIVALTGSDLYADQLLLTSLTNTPESRVIVRPTNNSATSIVGLVSGSVAGRSQPTAARLAAALNFDSTFNTQAAAWPVEVQGLGTFLRIDSLTSGVFSTLQFLSTANTAFVPTTNVGIVPGVTADSGEDAVAGFTVTSSTPGGSSGTGQVGRTYTDAQTGLRFTVLPASAGDYSDGGSFTLIVGQTFTCDTAIPIHAVPGVEVTVFNTVGMNPETTALLNTYRRTGNEPAVGDVYYISYLYGKTSYDTALFQDLKKIQQSFGPPSPDYPLSLAARLGILNGAVLVGLKQVLRDPDIGNATTASYVNAIDDLKKPITGNIKPDVITTLSTDPVVLAYLNQHCVFMSSPRQEGERVGVVGTAVGTTPTGVQAIARGLQSELMVVVYPDSFVLTIQDEAGNLSDRLVDGSYVAAALAGSMCSPAVDVATPLTRRQISGFKSVGRVLDPTTANQVAVTGVTVVEQIDTGMRVRHGLTTRTDTVITRTPSVTLTIHYVQQTMRAVLDPYIGQKFTASIPKQVEQAMAAAFQRLINSQIVSKVTGIVASVDENDPTVLRTEAIYVPVFPLEYIVSTLSIRIRS